MQSAHAQVLANVPAALFPYWAEHARQEFAGIPRDASFFAQSAEGLIMFFELAAAARKTCALPSRAADSVWHAWMQMDEAGLHRFCIRHFGKIIPHVEKAKTRSGMGEAMAVCLAHARRRASKPVGGDHLPKLFSLDRRLGMPHGFGYWIIGGMVASCALDAYGNPNDHMSYPEPLQPEGLALLGLVGKAQYDEATRQAAQREGLSGGGDGWAGVIDSGSDSDSGSSDGGSSDGGGSDGGGGGGCGGGCSS